MRRSNVATLGLQAAAEPISKKRGSATLIESPLAATRWLYLWRGRHKLASKQAHTLLESIDSSCLDVWALEELGSRLVR